MKQINKVLVANRGEIAVRIFDTLHQMGITSVAVYSSEDSEAMHAGTADERYPLIGEGLANTYLNIEQLVSIALECDADAIHPGYGFLSENPLFAMETKKAGLTFIGPDEEAIRLMGNKKEARTLAAKLGIPVIEGGSGNTDTLKQTAEKLGYPVMVKAAAGGGGKGMKIVSGEDEWQEIIDSTRREAKNYFGNDEIYIEKYLHEPRHIEIQLLADHDGNIVTLYERDCSVQRRHQKIIEEAPAPFISPDLRNNLANAAKKLATHIGYKNAGTVEFLVKNNDFYFLEMNTRIQVEHPVTEMVTGIDIVREQIHVALGKPLSWGQNDIHLSGHAIEARIYAEDPEKDFLPSPGDVCLHLVTGEKGLRVDTGLADKGTISSRFDPMVSKVIAYASNRETARKKLQQYLKNYVLLGVKTNISFLIDLIASDEFVSGKTHTGLVGDFQNRREKSVLHEADRQLLAMAYVFCNAAENNDGADIWQQIGLWRLIPTTNLLINGTLVSERYIYHNARHMTIEQARAQTPYHLIHKDNHSLRIDVKGNIHTLYYQTLNGEVIFHHQGHTARVRPFAHPGRETLREINKNPVLEGESMIHAPMHGTVIKINVRPNEKVNKGDTLMILESMKMENKITATAKAFVKHIIVKQGDMVADNSPLIELTDSLS